MLVGERILRNNALLLNDTMLHYITDGADYITCLVELIRKKYRVPYVKRQVFISYNPVYFSNLRCLSLVQ